MIDFCYSLPIAVDEPQPLSPCQRTKYTSHDEASPATAVRTSKCSTRIWLWNQEKPPKGIYSIFHHFSRACQGAWTSRSVTGLAFWPALGSAGRARTNELVSKLFFFLTGLFYFYTFCNLCLYFFCQWASGVGGSDRCNSTSRAEARSAKRTGEVGRQDGGEGSSDHEAAQTPADSM